MKTINLILISTLLLVLSTINVSAQNYCFTAPEGYGSATTGGGTATPITVTTYAELKTALTTSGSKVILVSGTITFPSGGMIKGVMSNKTLLGLPGSKLVNNSQTVSGILYFSDGSTNIILRNLILLGPGAWDNDGNDILCIDGCTKMWVDHCEFQDGEDGSFDIKHNSDNITVSWTKFSYLIKPRPAGSGTSDDHRFAGLIGSDDSDAPADGKFNVTWQNCWWAQGCVQRMSRCRNSQLHYINCYWNSQVASVLLGLGGVTDCYVENSVFAATGKKYENMGNGTVRLTSVGCVAPPANVGVAPSPTYTHDLIPATGVVSAVTGTCGAGATLQVTAAGLVSSSCSGTNYTLTTANVGSGTVTLNPAGGSYPEGTVVTITANPTAGNTFSAWSGAVTGTTNPTTITMTANKSVTATFAALPTYTLSTSVVGNGSVTLNPAGGTYPAGTVVTITANPNAGNQFSAWSGAVTGTTNPTTVTVDANKSVTATFAVSTTNYTLTITKTGTGTVTLNPAVGPYPTGTTVTITATPSGGMVFNGWSGSATGTTNPLTVTMTANKTINAAFITPSPTKKIAYVTDPASLLYGNDTKILTALKADTRFVVTEIDAKLTGIDYSSYDMVLISELASSTAAGMAALKGINKPVLMMKVHTYKTATGAWNWTSSTTAYGQNATETNIVVSNKLHPIFNGVTFVNTNEVNILSAVTNSKGLTYMDPTAFTSVTGGTISSLAIVKGQTAQSSILQIPAGTTVAGTVLAQNFVQIGINSESYANVTTNGVKIVINACCYLLGISGTPTVVKESNQSKVSCYPTVVDNTLNIDLGDNANGNAQIDIYGISGGKVLSVNESSNATIALNLSGLSKGVYCCVIRNENAVTTCKFIKK